MPDNQNAVTGDQLIDLIKAALTANYSAGYADARHVYSGVDESELRQQLQRKAAAAQAEMWRAFYVFASTPGGEL